MGPELAHAVGRLGPFRPPKKINQNFLGYPFTYLPKMAQIKKQKQKHFLHMNGHMHSLQVQYASKPENKTKNKNIFCTFSWHAFFACMCHAHCMHALCDSEKMCACTTTIPFICNLVHCSVVRNSCVIVKYCATSTLCMHCAHAGAKMFICAHA